MHIVTRYFFVFLVCISCNYIKEDNKINSKETTELSFNNFDFIYKGKIEMIDTNLFDKISIKGDSIFASKIDSNSPIFNFIESKIGYDSYFLCKINSQSILVYSINDYSRIIFLIRFKHSNPISIYPVAQISGDGSQFEYSISEVTQNSILTFFLNGETKFDEQFQRMDTLNISSEGIYSINISKDFSIDTLSNKKNIKILHRSGEDIDVLLKKEWNKLSTLSQ